jgi:intracellular sulfur oxidation DsrE/DsrF family protein
MRQFFKVVVALFAASWFGGAMAADPIKIVYHVNEGNQQATDALRNINNHLNADKTAKIVVVTHSKGIDFLLDGAKDANGNSYDALVAVAKSRGVEFRVCRNTLTSRKIDESKVIPDATIVQSGVAEVSRLQAQEKFVYLKP